MSIPVLSCNGLQGAFLAGDQGFIVEPWIIVGRESGSIIFGVDYGVTLLGVGHKVASFHFDTLQNLERWCYDNDVPMCAIPAGAMPLKVVK